MGTSPDQVRADIEATRDRLSQNVDRLADRTSPKRMVRRRADRARSAASGLRARVMGVASDTGSAAAERTRHMAHSAQGGAEHMGEAVKQAPEQVMRQAQGNPLAAGVIAFGAGMLAASLLPETKSEQQAVNRISDRAGEMMEPVKAAAAESAQRLKDDAAETARQAATQVKETAAEAARTTGEQAREQASHLKEQVRGSGQHVADEVRGTGSGTPGTTGAAGTTGTPGTPPGTTGMPGTPGTA
ncbi:DUF3618 domain-containing protein [Streptomyces somaliensis]|uniref:DUF3618 domain-containing protein n=1 Tax=Streptomyces somaliensis (strain ATCC 33201 / DSM 40738 / JCM 12659 / KCTC 9044 / NCTC 11332 / NRRL B-12077 / IP 733) TaxID=1134445 RepID=A0AA44DGJ3_STRE0|nr:DUF3618 domain-containing protein [Streptomyces somaliensis]NKY16204.1 DUF3618 domain-containing protein [Streptomyces somaliensis DSM 40738]